MVELEGRYKLQERGTRSVLTFLENKIQAASLKIKNFKKSEQIVRQNKLFKANQKPSYKELGGKTSLAAQAPNKTEARNFWNNIWSKEGTFNENVTWIEDFKQFVEEAEVEQMEEVTIKPEDISN